MKQTVWRILIVLMILVGIPLLILYIQAQRKGLTLGEAISQLAARSGMSSERTSSNSSILPHGGKINFLQPRPIGARFEQPPRIANVLTVDLDQDGLLDVIACDALNDRVVWLRQSPLGTFTETAAGPTIRSPARARPVDIDQDGDLDLVVASMGMLFPNNDKIGSVVILENDGKMNFAPHVILENVARVTDVSAGDLNGDGRIDLALAQFGYDDGETRWLENRGNWQFESHIIQRLSGPINAEIVDIDGDGDLDILNLVSQEWEEIYAFSNDGRGNFTAKLLYGSSNEDFGSSWISLVDMNKDGRPDILYSNGDAFDYIPPRPRPWHGVQWLENQGSLKFAVHRIADFPGACSPQAADFDSDGDLDVLVVSAYSMWENPASQSIAWLENDGRMRFAAHDIAGTPTHIVSASVGDFDNDGRPDAVTGGLHVYPPYDRLGRVTLWMNHWGAKHPEKQRGSEAGD